MLVNQVGLARLGFPGLPEPSVPTNTPFMTDPISFDPQDGQDSVPGWSDSVLLAGTVEERLEAMHYERQREHVALDHHAIVSVADAQGTITYVNDRFCEVSGYRRDELLGQNHRIVKSGEHGPAFYQEMWDTVTQGRIWKGEISNRRKDGSLYWVEATITPFMDTAGLPYQYISIRTDITHVKAVEQSLRTQRDLQRMISTVAVRLMGTSARQMDEAILAALRDSGEALGADRAYLFLHDDDGASMSCAHEWCAPQVAAQIDRKQEIPLEHMPWWNREIARSGCLSIPDVAQLPPEAAHEQAIFTAQGIRSLCGLPLQRDGQTFGFICYDIVRRGHPGLVQDADLLRVMADVFGSALERQRTERALWSSERKYRTLAENIPGMVYRGDPDWRVEYLSNAEAICGYTSAELQAMDGGWLGVVHPDDRGRVIEEGAEKRHSPTSIVQQYRIVHKSGEIRWVSDHKRSVFDERGWFCGVDGIVFDVTDIKRMERDAEAHKERLRRGQLYANIGTWEWNIQTGELFWTERIAPLFGYPEGDLETSYENFILAVHPDDRQAVTEAVRASVEDDALYEIEHRVVWPDGTVRWLLERGAAIRDADGRPMHMLGVVQDIDDRKRAELALAERTRQLTEAQSLASLGNWSADLETGELGWSDEIYRIFGHEPGSFQPSVEAFHAAVHPDDRARVLESERQAQRTGRHDVVHRIVRPDGTVRHVHELAQAQRGPDGALLRMTGTVQDITEQVQTEQALRAARDEAERANQAKSEFLSSMSHELRTPLNAILGFGQLLEQDSELSEDHRDDVQEIMKASRHLLGLINEVLDLAKVESGKIVLSLETVELAPLVQDCLALVQPMADQRGIHLVVDDPDGWRVRADSTRLRQVLLNLMSNAIKYNRDGGAVRLQVEPAGASRVRVWVRDTGPGIAPERLGELFQPFQRLGAENTEIEGTGIGLTITRRLVELMHGSLGVESEVGVGSGFWFELPLPSDQVPLELPDVLEDAEADAPEGATAAVAQQRSRLLLYIDDIPSNLRLIGRMLEQRPDCRLLTAHLPGLGLELAMAHRPDLILLDINMPDMNGHQVLKVIQADPNLRDIPVVAVTANAMPHDVERGRAAGFADYLTKPLDVQRFFRVIDACLTQRPGAGAP